MKKFKSIANEIVKGPVILVVIVILTTIASSIYALWNMENQVIYNMEHTIASSASQLEYSLNEIEQRYIDYWLTDDSYRNIKYYTLDTDKSKYVSEFSKTKGWITNIQSLHPEVQGVCAYFANVDLMVFSDNTKNYEFHDYIRKMVQEDNKIYNKWQLITFSNDCYLFYSAKYGNYYGGIWIPVEKILEKTGFSKDAIGINYIGDEFGNLYTEQISPELLLTSDDTVSLFESDQININNKKYINTGATVSDEIKIGTLIPRQYFFSEIPLFSKMVVGMAIIVVFMTPLLIVWIRNRIAIPVKFIDYSLKRIGEGDVDYRMPPRDIDYEDEFDHLMREINEMLDKTAHLESDLYLSKIKEQQTELKYISQQIRPHFILNALNVIYTYDVDEYDLAQEMVLYLTDYFRYIVNLKVDFVPLEQEFRHVENYLNIQKARYGDRFFSFVEWDPKAKDLLLPPLIIQTFVENCIKYGMVNDGTTFIYVLGSVEREKLKITIADTGSGFTEDKLKDINDFADSHVDPGTLGVGIINAIERMDILYGEKIGFVARNALSGGAVIELELPIKGTLE